MICVCVSDCFAIINSIKDIIYASMNIFPLLQGIFFVIQGDVVMKNILALE